MEETSINKIDILKEIDKLYEYELPPELLGIIWKGKFRGQRQKWFILRYNGIDTEINLNTKNPEFLEWKWIEPMALPNIVVNFKVDMYKKISEELKSLNFN